MRWMSMRTCSRITSHLTNLPLDDEVEAEVDEVSESEQLASKTPAAAITKKKAMTKTKATASSAIAKPLFQLDFEDDEYAARRSIAASAVDGEDDTEEETDDDDHVRSMVSVFCSLDNHMAYMSIFSRVQLNERNERRRSYRSSQQLMRPRL
jgi:hypothetical protein